MIANAAVDIWSHEGIFPVTKYEDNLKAFRIPSPDGIFIDGEFRYDYDRAEMLRRIESLGIPWHKEKGDLTFNYVTTFIGFLWDIPRKLVSLPEEKRLKFYHRVRSFLDRFDGHPCQLLDIERIHGSLCHVAFVYMLGRSHLPSLSNFASSFPKDNEFATRYPPHSVMSDLRWWMTTLSVPGVARPLRHLGPVQDIGLYVDASTSWGIGIIIGDEWAAFRLAPSWKVGGRDICWLETIAIELLAYFLEEKGHHDACLLIHSDNQGTIGALDKGRSRNFHINLSVRRSYLVFSSTSLVPEVIYITSEANPADPISRGEPGLPGKQIFPKFMLPDELIDIFLCHS